MQSSNELLKLENTNEKQREQQRKDHVVEKLLFRNQGKPAMKPVQSSVLSRVKLFVPQMKNANEKLNEELEKGHGAQYNIEETDQSSGPLIEMNLSLMPLPDAAGLLEVPLGNSSDSSSDSDSSDDEDEKTKPKLQEIS